MKEKFLNGKPSSSQTHSFRVVTKQLGVWYLHVCESNGFSGMKDHLSNIASAFPLFRIMAMEIYNLDPVLFIFFICSRAWSGVESALLMYMSGQVLREIEIGLLRGQPMMGPVITAISRRLICLVLAAFITWWKDGMMLVMKSKVVAHFEYLLMKANLRIDLPTSKDPSSKPTAGADGAWQAFEGIIDFLSDILTFASQMLLIINLSRSSGGLLFSVLCIAKPFVSVLSSKTLWDRACVAYINNPHYKRMKAMQRLSTETYRQDIISAHLSEHILNEYTEALTRLGNVVTDHPFFMYSQHATPWLEILREALGDLPMVYCAINAVRNPSAFSLSTIAILPQTSSNIRYSLESIFRNEQMFRKNMDTIQNIYVASEVSNKIVDGSVSYPQPETSQKGMSFCLQDIKFRYPGSTTSSSALNGISLEIKPGELVVIVGANGSGKSTLIRILSRLYDPTSGAVLIDGKAANSYKVADLHRATAILSQDNHLYPVSLGENIGLGYAEHANDKEMIAKAAERGGASNFISKLNDGMDTTLEQLLSPFVHNIRHVREHPLHQVLNAVEKEVEVSGGERQRVVAARTFMRFNSGAVDFVAVDEPSSALDAEGELHLFEELIKMRDGKTMIFVTHRFGHLTRHADKIICMKDGVIVENGTHSELMKLRGEYANLYDIQARAFLAGADGTELSAHT